MPSRCFCSTKFKSVAIQHDSFIYKKKYLFGFTIYLHVASIYFYENGLMMASL